MLEFKPKHKHIQQQILALILLLTLAPFSLAELVVSENYIRKPIPGRSMSAAFMAISNISKQDVIVTKASIEGARSVEIHTHSHKDGVMRMRQIHELLIPAGETVELKPGGLHLMVFGIKDLPTAPMLSLCDQQETCYRSPLKVRSLVKK